MTIETFYDPTGLSNTIGVATKTLAIWRWKGIGPTYHRLGRAIRYSASDVQKWLDANTVKTTTEEEV